MILAMNYWIVEPLAQTGVMESEQKLAIDLVLPTDELLRGEEVETKLIVNNGAGLVKGMHLVIEFDRNCLEFMGAEQSELLKLQEAPSFFRAIDTEGRINISIAVLGAGVTLVESGEIAILKFKLLSDQETEIKLTDVDLRDSANKRLKSSFTSTGIVETRLLMPKVYALNQNYPNPFSYVTNISYQIPKDSKVLLQIYDLTGQLVCNLVNETQTPGYYTVHWNGKDKIGNEIARGVYFCRLKIEPVGEHKVIGETVSETLIKKIILVR